MLCTTNSSRCNQRWPGRLQQVDAVCNCYVRDLCFLVSLGGFVTLISKLFRSRDITSIKLSWVPLCHWVAVTEFEAWIRCWGQSFTKFVLITTFDKPLLSRIISEAGSRVKTQARQLMHRKAILIVHMWSCHDSCARSLSVSLTMLIISVHSIKHGNCGVLKSWIWLVKRCVPVMRTNYETKSVKLLCNKLIN